MKVRWETWVQKGHEASQADLVDLESVADRDHPVPSVLLGRLGHQASLASMEQKEMMASRSCSKMRVWRK